MSIKVYKDEAANAIFLETITGVQFINSLQATVTNGLVNINDLAKGFAIVSNTLHSDFIKQDGTSYGSDAVAVCNELNAIFSSTGTAGQELPEITSSTSVALTTGNTLNYELVASRGVAYEWANLPTGITTVEGNVRKLIGGSSLSAGTYSPTMTAINYAGEDVETLTITVSDPPFATTKSIQFDSGDYAEATASTLDAVMGRSSNGDGKAWTLAAWLKPVSGASGRILFYYGSSDLVNGGFIEVRITGQNKIRFRYGSDNNFIQLQTTANLTAGDWQHIIITFDGGTTGSSAGSMADYYSRFNIIVDGVTQATTQTHSNNGYTGNVAGQNLRIAKLISGNTMAGDKVAHVGIWNTDETSNKSDIYNSGSAFDYMTLTNKPEHRWRMGDGDTFPNLTDSGDTGGLTFVLYNSTVANIVTDSP